MVKKKVTEIGDIIEVEFLDHEIVEDVPEEDLKKENKEIIPTKVYGVLISEFKDYLVIAYWIEEGKKSIARILKKNITNIEILRGIK